MSVRSLWRMMMGVVLCLMVQVPSLVMPTAMASAMEPPAMMKAMPASHSHYMVSARSASVHDGMEEGAAPACCLGHHSVCDAGVLPVGHGLVLPRISDTALMIGEHQVTARLLVMPPWRPPALLPV